MVFNSVITTAGSPSVPVSSFTEPFTIRVHTDSLEGSSAPAEVSNRGFCLNFVQQPCTSSVGWIYWNRTFSKSLSIRLFIWVY